MKTRIRNPLEVRRSPERLEFKFPWTAPADRPALSMYGLAWLPLLLLPCYLLYLDLQSVPAPADGDGSPWLWLSAIPALVGIYYPVARWVNYAQLIATRETLHIRFVPLWWPGRRFLIRDITQVYTQSRELPTRRGSVSFYSLCAVLQDESSRVLISGPDFQVLKSVEKNLEQWIGIPDQRVFGELQVTGRAAGAAPMLLPAGLSREQSPAGSRITYRWRTGTGLRMATAALLAICALAGTVIVAIPHMLTAMILFAALVLFAAGCGYYLLAMIFNVTQLNMDPARLLALHGPLWWWACPALDLPVRQIRYFRLSHAGQSAQSWTVEAEFADRATARVMPLVRRETALFVLEELERIRKQGRHSVSPPP